MRNFYTYKTLFGKVTITSDGKSITGVKSETGAAPPADASNKPTPLTDRVAKELNEYFAGKRRFFDVPLNTGGTDFQRSVWKALMDIPYGETRTYKQIAQMTGNPKACRAVGMANNKNPIWIIIPCHRVIGADGTLTGYGGGLEMKKKLLELEKSSLDKPNIKGSQQ
jgi:methylated-DNA-[protein]-cysteine S-methyltransferase